MQSIMRKFNRIAAAEHKYRSLVMKEVRIKRACRAAATEKVFAVLSDELQSTRTVFSTMDCFDRYYAQTQEEPEECLEDAYLTALLALKLEFKKIIINSEDSVKTLEFGLKELFDSELIDMRERTLRA